MSLTPEQQRLVQKRVPDHVCARCRREFEPGDRATWACIIINPRARNPMRITEKGLEFGTDLEFVHNDCEDPTLSGRKAGQIVVVGR
jgi:hypothetical protein